MNPNAAMHTVSIILFELFHLHLATTTQTFEDVSIIFYANAWLPMFAIMIVVVKYKRDSYTARDGVLENFGNLVTCSTNP